MRKGFVSLLFMLVYSLQAQEFSAWYGQWEGVLEAAMIRDVPKVSLEIAPISGNDTQLKWETLYIGQRRIEKRYSLRYKEGQLWEMDELNGIVIPMKKFENSLSGMFEVENQLIHAEYILDDGKIIYHLNVYNSNTTYRAGKEGETEVKARVPETLQRIVFTRKNN